MEFDETPQMLPPPPGSFIDREELIEHVGEFAVSQGYVVTIKQSKKERVVVLGCDRGGVYRDRRKPIDDATGEPLRKRKSGSRLTNCPFELVGKKEDGLWVLTVKNGSHNHEPMKDISEHPSARRFNEKEVMLIKEMTDAGLKPRQILKRLRQTNPELLSTPKHVYNVKAKLRQGNLTVRRLKTLKSPTAAEGNSEPSSSSEPSWKKRYPPRFPNLIGGRFIDSQSSTSIDVLNPATQQVVAQVPLSTGEELKAAVFAAKRAFASWRNTPVTTRQRIMFKLQELIRRDIDKLASSITSEQGKTLKDAFNDVSRGIELVEHACGMANLHAGDFFSNISNGVDTYSIREPLGICAGICSFNFPAMIPLLMFPIAITCGNTFILKPSEKAPGACVHLAELAMEAGLPNGVLNVIHGTNDIIEAICDDDEIKAVSYVGSDAPGMYVHARASANSKRVQTNVGAKSHVVVMPDANMDAVINALVCAGFGSAVQKCTAISTAIFVADSKSWEGKLVEHAMALKVDAGTEPGVDLGPVISKQVKERISRVVQTFVDNGARLVLDGRKIVVPKYELGNFVGPTILTDITEDMECYKEEILGPILLCMQVGSLDEAIGIVNRNKHGNGASIFTSSCAAARKFQTEIESGQVGVNVAVAAPLPLFSFTGSKASFTGDINYYGKAGLQFYTQIKTVTQQWKDFPSSGASSGLLAYDAPSNSGDAHAFQSIDFTSNDVSLGLHLREFSNGDGVPLPLHDDLPSHDGMSLPLVASKDFPSSDGESLEQSRDLPNSDGISSIPQLDGSHWTLHF
ncbi:methylmalonate-semialdehyde dehydrogenase [acylating], mitochondrial-like isoform X2 [Salvia miltiorrhiza]|uniref:methylmalonate-semialdehyde dehydrogenase [acylating], mitochondrial-like isoform X2 n=1 Tax=Salvia miltiorrhiza TaxID=226208 RepID=UPI0025AC01C0|nr:methylmalonate-semialdehyde dehydrogenase [acylating], mitochondrial-like isoform X2 [Salvia miltiorrhiza]XP_057787991.1 methylmalonate-semialdehyde dehydrogenase [acylating], mitochondrial-like isoform X2 [Salvia miltiorrhiza]